MKIKSVALLCGALALFSVTFATAQSNVSVGVRGGFTLPNLTGGNSDNPLNTGYSTAMRTGAGIFADIKFSRLFSIQPMLEYSEQGAKKNGYQAMPANSQLELVATLKRMDMPVPTYLYANFNSAAKFNYLMLPVLAKFGWELTKTSPFRIYIDAGPYAGLLVSAKQVTGGNSPIYLDEAKTMPLTMDPETGTLIPVSFDATTDIKDQLHNWNVGFEGNVGLQYQIEKQHKIFLEVGGNYGLINIQKGTANGKNHIGAATAMLGYAYTL